MANTQPDLTSLVAKKVELTLKEIRKNAKERAQLTIKAMRQAAREQKELESQQRQKEINKLKSSVKKSLNLIAN